MLTRAVKPRDPASHPMFFASRRNMGLRSLCFIPALVRGDCPNRNCYADLSERPESRRASPSHDAGQSTKLLSRSEDLEGRWVLKELIERCANLAVVSLDDQLDHASAAQA